MKKVSTLVACAAVLAWAGKVSADESNTLSEFRMVLPPEAARCLAGCTATAKVRADDRIASLARRVTVLEDQISGLRKQVGLLGKKKPGADQNAIAASVRTEIARLRGELDRLNQATAKDYVELAQQLYALMERIREIDSRLNVMERKGGVKIGPQGGFLVLRSSDGTTYTGLPVGTRLTLNLTDSWDIDFDANALVSGGNARVGTQVRGGLSWTANDWFAIEGGVGSSWVGYDNQLKAKSAFVTGDFGLVFSHKLVQVGVSGRLGSEFDSGCPAFAFGSQVLLRLELP
ncbi:MAG: hypothetical protein WCT10_01915 [Patescibacteria group bacterium]